MDEILLQQFLKDQREIQLMIALRSANQETKNLIITNTCPCLINRIIRNCYMFSDAELAIHKAELNQTIDEFLFKVHLNLTQ